MIRKKKMHGEGFFLLNQVAAAGGGRQHPFSNTLLLLPSSLAGLKHRLRECHWQMMDSLRRGMRATDHHAEAETTGCETTFIFTAAWHFPLLVARQAAEQEKEVRGGAEGNLFPVSLLQVAVVGWGAGWRAEPGTIRALSGKSCWFILLFYCRSDKTMGQSAIPSHLKSSAKLEILACTTPRTYPNAQQ